MNCSICGTEFPRKNQTTTCSDDECRFLAKVDIGSPDTCWEWTGSLESGGYGHMRSGHTTVKAHRFSYELAVEPIAEGLQIDHLCRNRRCVNPDHLEPVTPFENWARGAHLGAVMLRTGECPLGHSLDANPYIRPSGRRECRTCRNLAKNRYYARKVKKNA